MGVDGLIAMGITDEAIGESINLGSGKDQKVSDMANIVKDIP